MEEIIINDQLYAIVISKDYKSEGIRFFTPSNFSQQLAYMKRPKDYNIQPHFHNEVKRTVSFTQEVLFIKSGSLYVDFYDYKKILKQSYLLVAGDVILLSSGGHGFRMIEETEIIEVKQGPYSGDMDKTRFKPKIKSK